MKIDFSTANRIIFGAGELSSLGKIISGQYGKRVLIIKGKQYPDPGTLFEICEDAKVEWKYLDREHGLHEVSQS